MPLKIVLTPDNFVSELKFEVGRLRAGFNLSEGSEKMGLSDLINIVEGRIEFFNQFFSFFLNENEEKLKALDAFTDLSSIQKMILLNKEGFLGLPKAETLPMKLTFKQVDHLYGLMAGILRIKNVLLEKVVSDARKTPFLEYLTVLESFLAQIKDYSMRGITLKTVDKKQAPPSFRS